MNVVHRIRIEAVCPVNGDPDLYAAAVFVPAGRLLYCEDVVAAVAAATRAPATQEVITQALADRVACRVVTVGTHVRGRVETTVEAFPCLASPAVAPGEWAMSDGLPDAPASVAHAGEAEDRALVACRTS